MVVPCRAIGEKERNMSETVRQDDDLALADSLGANIT
jgi:hypothetical protein